jgi:hypothetical protein
MKHDTLLDATLKYSIDLLLKKIVFFINYFIVKIE